MTNEPNRKDTMAYWLMLAAVWGALIGTAFLCGCSSPKNAGSPSVCILRDTVRLNSVRIDSLYVRDSVHVDGNTEYRERIIYKNRILTDTAYVVRTDTVSVPTPCYVERQEAWYDTACKQLGRLCIIAGLLWLIFLYLKRKR